MEILKIIPTLVKFVFDLAIGFVKAIFSVSNAVDSIKENLVAVVFNVPVMVVSIIGIALIVIRISFKIYDFIVNRW